MTHTPTPWTIELDNDDGQRLQWYTVGPARVLAPYDGPGERQAKADAQFIRTACNAHEELVEALKAVVTAYNQLLPGIGKIAVQDYKNINEAPILAKQALAKVEAC